MYYAAVFDFPDIDRTKVRPQHFAELVPSVANPIVAGGAIYHDDAKTKFAGSWLQLDLTSKEEVIEFLRKDVYYREGVWDIDSAIIYPIGVAVRLPQKLEGTDDSLYKV
ncbi:uncharacterized protein SPAPADRAFT_146775 [Spathaspora passalidarum NRRL Y-27907]|uniref:YCII-related domain-containing protein n=1 Tax=Spathaspora passalidarum (strain NRRL Y-27907 / 11-Y1) TaxID=619300 RepID=G3AH47_SPAPN|nr:uncharacterized protein SPAPADRAFT_146775 [Spathaspora passalidarum NRRL Y-27907]EGW35476.1 hypothetical protein SPAPADRAFT_146775 [Spathaspora passalidarum NRRL Y-27907]